jgi:integrase
MAIQHRLFRRNNGYFYHRVKVPADIRAIYGKEIEQISLGTTDLRTARKLLPSVMVAIDQRFIDFRNRHLDQLVVADIVVPPVPLNLPTVRQQSTKDKQQIASILGAECFKELKREKAWSAKTEITRQTQLRLFIEICGDKPLDEYTQADIRSFKQTLYALPPGASSTKKFANLSKSEIARKAKDLGLPGLSIESIRQIMTTVSILFGWARANSQSTLVNLIHPMIPPPPSSIEKRNNRDGFTIKELNMLFSLPFFCEGSKADMPGRYWIPLLSLFSGLRLMEAVQLVKEDLRREDGIWFIDVNEAGEAKQLKNTASQRCIPIHPELERLGFIEFVQQAKAGARLFPDIDIGPPEQRQRYASKVFSKLLVEAGIKSKTKVWHSMRHTFEQACRDSAVDSAVMDQLQGHTQKGMRGVYGQGYRLGSLKDAVASIRYEGLALPS